MDRVVLYINRSSSRCGACGKECDLNEKKHDTVLGYSASKSEDPKEKEGCHATYTHISTDYAGMNPSDMRPDLIWIDPLTEIGV